MEMHFMKSILSVLKRRKRTRNIFLKKKQACILHSIHRKGRGNNLCLPKISTATTVIATSTAKQEQYDNDPAGIITIVAAASAAAEEYNDEDEYPDTAVIVASAEHSLIPFSALKIILARSARRGGGR